MGQCVDCLDGAAGCLSYDDCTVSHREGHLGWHRQNLWLDKYAKLVILMLTQLIGNLHAFVVDCSGEELLSRPNENVSKKVQTGSNGNKYLAAQSSSSHEVVIESLAAIQEYVKEK